MIGQFGINMLVPVFICTFLGMLIDRKLETNFFVFVLFAVGALSGGYNIYRFARQIYQKNSEKSAYLHRGRRKDRRRSERSDYEDQ